MSEPKTTVFTAKGMHCGHCEAVVEKAIKQLPGVRDAKADYGAETVEVRFDPDQTDLFRIFRAVELKGYDCSLIRPSARRHEAWVKLAEIALGLAGIGLIFYIGLWLEEGEDLPLLGQHLSHGMIFLVGLLTGFHCVGMCGGLVIGYTVRTTRDHGHHAMSHLAYALGKTISYTLLGAVFGYLGSLVTFTPQIRSITAVVAGIFLLLFGLNMLHLFPHIRLFGIRPPGFLSRYLRDEFKKHNSPLIVGMLNGLMIACGPLQAMYVMAAGTGSLVEGATILFLFGIGTLPLLIGFGFLASLVSRQATGRFLQASGVLVVALGLIMLNRGLVLGGSGYDFRSLSLIASAKLGQWSEIYLPSRHSEIGEAGYQIIRMEVDARGYRPDRFLLKRGQPVRWIIHVAELTECNRGIVVPKLGLTIDLREGEQVIEFTPREAGVIPWSCWMGMIPGSFVVESGPDDRGNAEHAPKLPPD
ncbi:sulfite exporter TauE/SafE family protein [Methylococcus sp. EFPC2]|uniref:urease accessory protein UreH domain-containing protein n=1 Tax=Methylococcus sp. EFPC2 TaxID=2812648 RepID=UPI00196846AE|nr:sulfite exporter TauE/SafE family protein [Methylococcus sp. EFPC2]QSA98951.1 sulfite exporter TauE/SafE family protein [Methylococcus sp. EFPC2]